MAHYQFTAKVERTVLDTIHIKVEASSRDIAKKKAERVLSSFPEEHTTSKVPYCYIADRVQADVEVLSVEEDIKLA